MATEIEPDYVLCTQVENATALGTAPARTAPAPAAKRVGFLKKKKKEDASLFIVSNFTQNYKTSNLIKLKLMDGWFLLNYKC